MDNFRNFKAQPRQTSAVDGFVARGARTSRPQRVASPAKPGPAAQRPAKLDGFRGTDGFRPTTQGSISASTAPSASQKHRAGRVATLGQVDTTLPGEEARGRRGKARRKSGKKRIILRLLLILLLLGVILGGYIVGKAYLAVHGVFKGGGNAPALAKNVDPTKLNGEGDGRVNILMLGRGGEGHEGADLTDTILVASIDPINKKASILSIPRDLWVKNPSGGSSKINAVFATAKNAKLTNRSNKNAVAEAEKQGVGALESVVENTMGIPIHYYTMVDFVGFEKAINTVGGIDITIDANNKGAIVRETLWNELTGKNYTLDVKAGQNHFDGQRALMYSRSRHVSARGDFDRAERQRMVILAFKDKVLSAGTYSNPVKISQLIGEFGDHVTSNLSTGEIMRIYDLAKGIESAKINSVGLADPPNNFVTTDNISGQSIVRPRAGLTDFSEIQNYVRNTLKDGYIQKESANLAVYNGSKIPGLAAKRATDLRSYGYTIPTVANAPAQTYTQTVLVDLTGGKKPFTQHYLEERLKVKATTTMPDTTISTTGLDFVIILGQNESANP